MTYRTFGQLNQNRYNNFNFLRFSLAVLVIFSHSFLLLLQSGSPDPVMRLTRGQMTGGSWAVQGFFIISGFLIAQSWERKPNLGHFLKNRALRIYPGWIIALLLCTFVAAPLSGVAIGTLLHNQNTWLSFLQLLLHASPSVPNVFANNPVPNVLNGSLWTIPLEILCYLVAAFCGLCSLKSAGSVRTASSPRKVAASQWCVLLLFAIGLLTVKFVPSAVLGNLPWFGNLEALPFYGTCFLSGMMLHQFQDFVPFSWPLFLICVGVMVTVALRKHGMAIPFILCGSYVLLFVAFLPLGLSQFGRWADLSYGIYLYAYPIQQLIIEYTGHRIVPMQLFFETLPPTFLLAVASWFLVERPFLRLKKSPKSATPSPPIKEATGLAASPAPSAVGGGVEQGRQQ